MKNQIAVVVTTEFKGVFFGFVPKTQKLDANTIRLERARMCIYWSADMRGVLGLAITGPSKNCKIGPAVPAITLQKVTGVTEMTPEAIEAWEKAPWSM